MGNTVSRYTRSPAVACLVLTLLIMLKGTRVPVSTSKDLEASGAASGACARTSTGTKLNKNGRASKGCLQSSLAYSGLDALGSARLRKEWGRSPTFQEALFAGRPETRPTWRKEQLSKTPLTVPEILNQLEQAHGRQ